MAGLDVAAQAQVDQQGARLRQSLVAAGVDPADEMVWRTLAAFVSCMMPHTTVEAPLSVLCLMASVANMAHDLGLADE